MKRESQHSNKAFHDVIKSMQRPQGSFSSTLTIEKTAEVFNKKISAVVVLKETAGQQLFLLERNEEMIFTFYHFSPGTGTREASLNINKISLCPELMIVISWTPSEILLLVTPSDKKGGGITTAGKRSDKNLRVGTDGKIYHLGDKRKRKMLHVTVKGELVIQPTAIEVWEETLLALDALTTGESTEGELYESAISNMSIVMLVTGFESYAKKRFLEIEAEGIIPNEKKVIKRFYTSWQKTEDYIQKKYIEANKKSISLVHLMVLDRNINFQEFDKCKQVFNLAYNIQFYHLGLKDSLLEELKIFFNYRHKIIHVHPAAGILNPEKAGIEKPIYSNKELIKKAKSIFDEFIQKLHQKTLELVPEN